MLESTKEDATGLPEGSDIGLGARCREFESPHSDQKSPQNISFEAIFITFLAIICLAFCINKASNVVNSGSVKYFSQIGLQALA